MIPRVVAQHTSPFISKADPSMPDFHALCAAQAPLRFSHGILPHDAQNSDVTRYVLVFDIVAAREMKNFDEQAETEKFTQMDWSVEACHFVV